MIGQILPNNNEKRYRNFFSIFFYLNTPNAFGGPGLTPDGVQRDQEGSELTARHGR
jgi:hypothetical protein